MTTNDDAPADPYIGRVITGRFRVDAQIAVGSVGTVYRATDLELASPVAVKILRASLAADPTTRARFTREARLASQLDHPNVARVYAYGTEGDGLTCLVMELHAGRELADLMATDARIPPRRIVGILSQVLAALDAAHQLGIVHRDLKPENILLAPRDAVGDEPIDAVKVVDFGIARVYGDSAAEWAGTITAFGSVPGTPEYMSPEHSMGDALDGRSDLYSVGVILYELLAGQAPFRADSPLEVLEQHVRRPVTPPSRVRAGVDPRLEAVAMRALAKNRADRYADAAEMRAALLAALEPEREPAREPARDDARDAAPPTRDDAREPPAPQPQPSAATADTSQRRPELAQRAAPPPARRRRWITAVIALVLGAAAVGAWWLHTGSAADAPSQGRATEAR